MAQGEFELGLEYAQQGVMSICSVTLLRHYSYR